MKILTETRPCKLRGRGSAEGVTTRKSHLDKFHLTLREQEPRRYVHTRVSLNIDVGPELSEEIKRMFPETRFSRKLLSWASSITGNKCLKAGPEDGERWVKENSRTPGSRPKRIGPPSS
jgi:hypothetical protein